ncbi:MAG: AraC family transcriptional regulator [Pseudomonadota bacterium]
MTYRYEFAEGATNLAELPAIGRALQTEAILDGLPEHSHPGAFEFVVVTKGRLSWWVEEEELDLAAGQLFCTKPDERHGAVGSALEPSEIMWVQVCLDRPGAFGLPNKDRELLAKGFIDALRVAPSSPIQVHHLQCILDGYERGGARPAFVWAHAICFLESSLKALTKPQSQLLDPRINQAMRLMRADRHARLSLPIIAGRVGLSESWFYALFQRSTGLAPAVWLREIRIDEAKALLKQTDRPITRIAHDLGFASSQYFATVFRKRTGQTPRTHRSSSRKSVPTGQGETAP